MSNNKNLKKKSLNITFILVVVSLMFSLVLLAVVLHERDRLNVLYDQETRHSMENHYRSSRITFCYENDIKPCTDAAISEWNEANPEEAFSIVSPRL